MLRMFFNEGFRNNKATEQFLAENSLKEVINIDTYFKNVYDKKWFDEPYVKKLVKEIGNTKVIANGVMDSPFLGIIPPTSLSGSLKGLILLKYGDLSEVVLDGSFFGDDCAKYILEIAREKDVLLIMHHVIDFGEFSDEVFVINVGKYCRGTKEYKLACREALACRD